MFIGILYYIFYICLGIIALPLLPFYTLNRLLKKKEILSSFFHRFSISKSVIDVNKPLIHVHAASVGEFNSALKLIENIEKRGYAVLLTTTTLGSYEMVNKKLNLQSSNIYHYFFPYDILPVMLLFFARFNFEKSIFIESEIWPVYSLLSRLFNRDLYLVSARISDASKDKWMKIHHFSELALSFYKKILTQSTLDVTKFMEITSRNSKTKIAYLGNLKLDTAIPKSKPLVVEKLYTSLYGYKAILAASTHEREEELFLQEFTKILKEHPKTRLIIAIRHVHRAESVIELCKKYGFTPTLHSEKNGIIESEVYINDTIGEMANFYEVSNITVMAGSFFAEIGGHNPVDAAYFSNLVVTGPYFANQQEIYETFFLNRAAIKINDISDLSKLYDDYLNNDYNDYPANAQKIVSSYNTITERVLNEIDLKNT